MKEVTDRFFENVVHVILFSFGILMIVGGVVGLSMHSKGAGGWLLLGIMEVTIQSVFLWINRLNPGGD